MKPISLGALKILSLTYLTLVAAIPDQQNITIEEDYHERDVITRDVCIIGGGSAGTYSAIRLLELGQTVIVIEKESLMGGHTNTFTVRSSGLKIDYGVVVFHNNSVVQDYFSHFKIPLAYADFGTPNTTANVDFRTGQIVAGFVSENSTLALEAWVVQLQKYPFLAAGFNLPDPVPEDLLLSFNDFVQKYNLDGMVQLISQLDQGYADLLNRPTLYAMKSLGLDLVRTVQNGYITTARHDNYEIYDAATIELSAAKSLLLSSYVISVDRNYDGKGSAKIVAQTPTGKKLIKARKIVVAIPPRTSSFKGWDLDNQEKDVFGTYRNEAYYTCLLTNTGIPDSFAVNNIGANTSFNLPALPGIYGIRPTAQPGLIDVKYGSPFEQDDTTVKKNIVAALGRLNITGVTTTPEKATFAAFNAHVPFFEHVTSDQIKEGFYKRATGLQGYRGVWYTGAAWETHDSSQIWNFTEILLPEIVKA